VVLPAASTYAASFEALGPQGRGGRYTAILTPESLNSLTPGIELIDLAVDVYMYNAADILLERTGADVRLIPSGVFREWQDWATRKPGTLVPKSTRLASSHPPSSLVKADLTGSDYVLLAWHDRRHYSTVLVCNAGNAI